MGEAYLNDENGHWLGCTVCEYTTEAEIHIDEDADKKCDVCGYELPQEPVEPEQSVEPEKPEEPEEEEIPKTADVSMMVVVAVLMLAVCGTAVVLGKKRFA